MARQEKAQREEAEKARAEAVVFAQREKELLEDVERSRDETARSRDEMAHALVKISAEVSQYQLVLPGGHA